LTGYGLELCLHSVDEGEPGQGSRYSDSLRVGPSGDLIPVEARFFTPIQSGTETHPASYTVGNGSFQEVKRPGCGVDHPPPYSAEVKERVELYSTPPLGLRDLF
jgi:hypothetical protein